jgi:NADH-quinone oxidoreductase subunit M
MVTSRDISFREGAVLVPLVAVIVALAFYPQLALHKGAPSINRAVSQAALISGSTPQQASVAKPTP